MGIPKKKLVPEESLVQLTDLRSITRRSDTCHTVVTIHLDWETKIKWLEFGEANIRSQRDNNDGRWSLNAYMGGGVTDFEHDSAYALQLPLIGLRLGSLAILYHQTRLDAWIDPDAADKFSQDFRVPRSGYNPMGHKDAHVCKQCKDESKGHVIVPEGFYVPPFDLELYQAVRGKRVEILIGPTFKEEEP